MKHLARLICGSLLLALLAACVPVHIAAPTPATDTVQSAATTDAAFPVTLEHKYGSTTISEQPVRIVTVGLTDHDALLALGIVPVGTSEWFGDYPGSVWPWAQDKLGDVIPEAVGASRSTLKRSLHSSQT